MNPNRLRAGALLWLLTLQFFVVEAVAQTRWTARTDLLPYSRVDDVISDLGTALSPAHTLMNASFVVQGVLILGGALLLGPALRGRAARIAQLLLGLAAVGVVLVGVFPLDEFGAVHDIGAVVHLVGGGIGLIALAYAVRPRSEALGTVLALLGVISTALTVFFLTGVVQWFGEGGTERGAAYLIPVGLALAGVWLWRLGTDVAPKEGEPLSKRQLREQERAERAEEARRRDAALEEAAARQEAARRGGPLGAAPAGSEDDDFDAEDPWAPSSRRDER